jgi:hypothetical protein
MTKRFLKIGALVGAAAVALLLVSGLHTSSTALAGAGDPTATPTPMVVNTLANVDAGGGAVPVVDAKWELPDMQKAAGFQYSAGSGPTDLNANTIPDADDDPLTTGMQMYPWLCDDPEARAIQYWAIAEDETGLADIIAMYDKVYQPGLDAGEALCPDGSPLVEPPTGDGYCFKYQADLAVVDCSAIGSWDESVPSSVVTLAAPILAAIDTNQITKADAENLVKRCTKGEVVVAMTTKTIAQHEPAGVYKVTASALDHNANEGTRQNTFKVLPIIGLRKDFTQVDWGSIQALIKDVVSGDEDLGTPLKPTLKDCGNIDMGITLKFSDMVQQGVPGPKIISNFDAKLLGTELEFVSGTPRTFTGCLIPCHPKQLDLSIHPPALLPAGLYKGTLDITGKVCGE